MTQKHFGPVYPDWKNSVAQKIHEKRMTDLKKEIENDPAVNAVMADAANYLRNEEKIEKLKALKFDNDIEEAMRQELNRKKFFLRQDATTVFQEAQESGTPPGKEVKKKNRKLPESVCLCNIIPEGAISGVNQADAAKKIDLDPRTMMRTAKSHYEDVENNKRKILCYSEIKNRWFIRKEHTDYYAKRPRPGRKSNKSKK